MLQGSQRRWPPSNVVSSRGKWEASAIPRTKVSNFSWARHLHPTSGAALSARYAGGPTWKSAHMCWRSRRRPTLSESSRNRSIRPKRPVQKGGPAEQRAECTAAYLPLGSLSGGFGAGSSPELWGSLCGRPPCRPPPLPSVADDAASEPATAACLAAASNALCAAFGGNVFMALVNISATSSGARPCPSTVPAAAAPAAPAGLPVAAAPTAPKTSSAEVLLIGGLACESPSGPSPPTAAAAGLARGGAFGFARGGGGGCGGIFAAGARGGGRGALSSRGS
mmetsp:Transcript_77995/g.253050  ORF Transcript_77995/g.253050 Transcript_77995/m.253050 type:complete len:280 (-) Transcript_77995:2420-3259(-)